MNRFNRRRRLMSTIDVGDGEQRDADDDRQDGWPVQDAAGNDAHGEEDQGDEEERADRHLHIRLPQPSVDPGRDIHPRQKPVEQRNFAQHLVLQEFRNIRIPQVA